MVEHLAERFHIYPDKSTSLSPPPLEDEVCILAYIRGLIDGDGSVSRRTRDGCLVISYTAKTKAMAEWVKAVVDDLIPSDRLANVWFREEANVWCYSVASCRAERLRERLMAVPGPYLARKWTI